MVTGKLIRKDQLQVPDPLPSPFLPFPQQESVQNVWHKMDRTQTCLKKTPFISFPNSNHHCCVLIWTSFCGGVIYGAEAPDLYPCLWKGSLVDLQRNISIGVVKRATTNIPGLWRHNISPHPSLVRPAAKERKQSGISFIILHPYILCIKSNINSLYIIVIYHFTCASCSAFDVSRPSLAHWWLHFRCFPCTWQVALFFSPQKFGIARRCQASNPWSLPPNTAELECENRATNKLLALRRCYTTKAKKKSTYRIQEAYANVLEFLKWWRILRAPPYICTHISVSVCKTRYNNYWKVTYVTARNNTNRK